MMGPVPMTTAPVVETEAEEESRVVEVNLVVDPAVDHPVDPVVAHQINLHCVA